MITIGKLRWQLVLSCVWLIALTTVLATPTLAMAGGKKAVVGWIERARLYPGDLLIRAKLDTGATTSSLHCDCITPYERDGAKWVRFGVTDESGKTVSLERKIVRMAKVKRHYGEKQDRMVVKLGVCLADIYKEIEVTLVDRTGFNYQMLVGRNFLRGNMIVDSDTKYTVEPGCKDAPQS